MGRQTENPTKQSLHSSTFHGESNPVLCLSCPLSPRPVPAVLAEVTRLFSVCILSLVTHLHARSLFRGTSPETVPDSLSKIAPSSCSHLPTPTPASFLCSIYVNICLISCLSLRIGTSSSLLLSSTWNSAWPIVGHQVFVNQISLFFFLKKSHLVSGIVLVQR